MGKNKMELPSPYKTIGTGIHQGNFAPDNHFNAFMVQKITSNGTLVDFIGKLHESENCVSLRNLGTVNGKSPRYDLQLARSVNWELINIGVDIEPDFYKKNRDMLLGVYMVVGLAYCSVMKRDKTGTTSFLCTKNPSVIKLICEQYNFSYPYSAVEKYADRFHITTEELEGNYLRCVKVIRANNKLVLQAATVYPHSKASTLLPMYDIAFFSDVVHNGLSKGIFEVTFKSNGGTYRITSSLNKNVLMQRCSKDAEYIVDIYYSKDDIGIIRLVDLNTQRIAVIRLIDIVSIRKLS